MSGKELLLPAFVNTFSNSLRSWRILFLPSQPTGVSPTWAMTKFILPESLLWLITVFFSQRQTQPGAFPRALRGARPPPPKTTVLSHLGVHRRFSPMGRACVSTRAMPNQALLLQGVAWAEVLPTPPCPPAVRGMLSAFAPGSGQGAALWTPWQEVLWTTVAKSTVCHWLEQQVATASGLVVRDMLAASTWRFSAAWRITNPTLPFDLQSSSPQIYIPPPTPYHDFRNEWRTQLLQWDSSCWFRFQSP